MLTQMLYNKFTCALLCVCVSVLAQMVYKKVMEHYPGNGKVLKCYGKFLEEVKNDIGGATKFYKEGNRLGSTDAIMNM